MGIPSRFALSGPFVKVCPASVPILRDGDTGGATPPDDIAWVRGETHESAKVLGDDGRCSGAADPDERVYRPVEHGDLHAGADAALGGRPHRGAAQIQER